MGWVNTLVEKLFNRNDIIESVRFDDLQLWLDHQAREIISKQKLEWEIDNYVANLKGERWVLECKLDEWESMVNKLDNSFRKQEIGSFFSETRKLLEILTFAEKIGVQRMQAINKIVKKKIEKLLSTVEKSSFAHEYSFIFLEQDKEKNEVIVNPLIQSLIKLNGLRVEFERKVTYSGIPLIIYLQEKLSNMEEATAILSQKGQLMKERKDRLRSALAKMKEKKEDLEECKSLPGYSNYKDNKERKAIVLQMKHDCEQKIIDFFSLFKPAFEKYLQLEPENYLVKDYLTDSVNALTKDESLSLKHSLQHINALSEAGKFEFPLKQEIEIR